eukprot:6053464-Amphidinium_carterae.1
MSTKTFNGDITQSAQGPLACFRPPPVRYEDAQKHCRESLKRVAHESRRRGDGTIRQMVQAKVKIRGFSFAPDHTSRKGDGASADRH